MFIKGTTYFLGNYALGADSGLAFDKCILPLLDTNFSRWVLTVAQSQYK